MASDRIDQVRRLLARGPATPRQLVEKLGISQPTLSRTLSAMGAEVLRLGSARSIQYLLRDTRRGLADMPVYRVDAAGKVGRLGVLTPVAPDGFLMRQDDGVLLHSEGLPWWLLDMRPQGFVGRAYAARHAQALGLPASLAEWSDVHALRALLAHGHDAVGNLLIGDLAHAAFLGTSPPVPIALADKPHRYASLAEEAVQGENPGSSAGGEQPKFTVYVDTTDELRHVLVKFTLPDDNPVTERWRDLLLAEHHALQTLRDAGVAAARTQVVNHAGQRFLESERFDRVGALGRRAIHSLAAVEAEFVGDATAPWPTLAERLAAEGHVTREAVESAALLYAFGTLIGNTDMHNGNLSFVSESGRPYQLAPAYDMLPMGFAPRSGGGLPETLAPATLRPAVPTALWLKAIEMAGDFLQRLKADGRLSANFSGCIEALTRHLADAGQKAARLT